MNRIQRARRRRERRERRAGNPDCKPRKAPTFLGADKAECKFLASLLGLRFKHTDDDLPEQGKHKELSADEFQKRINASSEYRFTLEEVSTAFRGAFGEGPLDTKDPDHMRYVVALTVLAGEACGYRMKDKPGEEMKREIDAISDKIMSCPSHPEFW